MKNLLIISFFHSSKEEVGAIRTQRFARYLPDFGWMPYILTKSPVTTKRDQTITGQENTFYVPTLHLNKPFHLESLLWVPGVLRKAVEILRKIPMEAVLISCPPFHQAMAGILLKKWLGTKLVVDYRDAWGLNPYRQRLGPLKRLILKGETLLERSLLQNTCHLLVTHKEMKDRYSRQFRFLGDRIEVIYNGFDPEWIKPCQYKLFEKFTILHLGNFYAKQKTRDPGVFLTALQSIISEKKISRDQLQVLFIGERYREIEEAITSRKLFAYVSCLDRLPHTVAIEYLNKSHVLLLIEAMDVMTSKVYEYLATGKPMLCLIKEGGELEAFVRRFSANAYILPNDIEGVKEGICACYEQYRRGQYKPLVNPEFQKEFTRKEQARRLAELLDQLRPEGVLPCIRGR